MHATAYDDMKQLLDAAPAWATTALDVGSLDENGTNRPLTDAKGWTCTGVDIRQGPNVDKVVEPYDYPFMDNSFDVVLSGQAMEHVEDLVKWINELVRVLKPGGRLCITTVSKMFYHPYPVDCWRIMPDGMKWLFDQTDQLTDYDIRLTFEDTTGQNIVGAATKRGKS